MMAYFKFNFKKLIRNPIYAILIVIPIILSFIGLGMNMSTTQSINPISDTRETIKLLQSDIKDAPNTSVKKALQDQLASNNNFLDLVKAKKWQRAYTLKSESIQNELTIAKQDSQAAPKELIDAMLRDKKIYEYLAEKNIAQQDTDFAVHGIDFSVWTINFIVPFVVTLIVVFSLSQLFTDKYKNKLNISRTIPNTSAQVAFSELGVGVCYALISLLILISVDYCVSSAISGVGSLSYPYPILDQGKISLLPAISVLTNSIFLQSITMIFIVELIYFISMFFKSSMTAAFTSVSVIIGYQLLLATIEPIQRISGYIPLTYLNSVPVVTKELNNRIHQDYISFNLGVSVVLISVVFITLLILLITITKDKILDRTN